MKKNKLKALVKSTRKATTQTIKTTLIVQLNETAEKLGIISKKAGKEIEKAAKKLAKALSAEIKVDKDALAKAVDTKEVAAAPVAAAEPVDAPKVAKVKAEKATV